VLDRAPHAIIHFPLEEMLDGCQEEGCEEAGQEGREEAGQEGHQAEGEAQAAIVGASPLPRTELTKKLWAYIKKHGLQDKKNRRMINADDKLKVVFGGKGQVSMFDMTKLVSKNVK